MRSKIRDFSLMKPTAVSLQDLYRYNLHNEPLQRIRNAQFLHKELPIRLAQRIQELSSLPFGLAEKSGVLEVKEAFTRGFESLLVMDPPKTLEDDDHFTTVLKSILQDNTSVIQCMALGVLEVRADMGPQLTPIRSLALDNYLNRFFMARIGLRFLLEHHITSKKNNEGFSGIIQSNCNPMTVAQHAAEDSMDLCHTHFGVSPLVRIQSPNPNETFTYVPAHLHYILSELLKNALRATVNFHGVDAAVFPPVEVVIARGRSDVTIKISDRGGGIPFDKSGLIWTYCMTSTPNSSSQAPRFKAASMSVIHGQAASLAGYGCGLPLARLYSQYFGGGLDVKSMEGFGTDSYCHLNWLGNNCENLPLGVTSSPAERDSSFT